MEWLDKLTQQTLFPGQCIYKVSPIFNEYDIQKVRVLDVTFNINGLNNFYYMPEPKGGLHHWEKDFEYYNEQAFFHSIQDAITWCQKQGKEFTIYDSREI